MKLQAAQDIANEIAQSLHLDCINIEIAGSIRRQMAEVKDIEIVYISKVSSIQMGLFASIYEPYFHAYRTLDNLITVGTLAKDTKVKRWGPKYKRLIHCASGIVVELFRAATDNWGYILALRTGPANFNKLLVTKRAFGGALPPDIELRGGYVWYKGKQLPAPTEHAFFANLDLPLIPPRERTAERLRRCIQHGQTQ